MPIVTPVALLRLVAAPALAAAATAILGLGTGALVLLLVQGLGQSALLPAAGAVGLALAHLVPAALELVLPVGALAGSAVVGARLAERHALLGLAASGIRLRRLVGALFLVGLPLAGLQTVLCHEWAPRGRATARQVLQQGTAGLRLRPGEPTLVGRERVLLRAGSVSGSAWTDVFVATEGVVAAAARGRMEAGGLVLEAGQAAPVPDRLWTLRFARAELRLAPAAARVELDERSSPHLRDLIARMRGNGRSVESERLVWLKRFTLPAMVPLLVVGAFAAGARTRRPGVVVAGFSAAWWVGLRLADKGADLTGAGGAAALPMVLLVALTVMLWRTWRLA